MNQSIFLPQESKRRIFRCEGLLTDKNYEKSSHVFMNPWTRSFQNNASNEMTITWYEIPVHSTLVLHIKD